MKTRYAQNLLLATLLAAGADALAAPMAVTEAQLPKADLSPTLASMAKAMPLNAVAQPRRVVPLRLISPAMRTQAPPTSARGQPPASSLTSGQGGLTPGVYTGGPLLNIDGIASDGTSAPPDPNGAVGDSQYVQWVNTRLAIYNKANGALLLGPIPGNALFAGMTGSPGADACRTSNWGDPIVQYDKQARRWILTQFAWDPAKTDTGPYYQCIAVSTSADATGSYYRYAWEIHNDAGKIVFPDYPKVGVWPDAIYFTWVLFESATAGGYLGPRACGVDRAALLSGGSASARCYDFGTAYGPILPSDLDGTAAPPAGSPNYMLTLDFLADGTGDHLFMWRFSFANATVNGPVTVPVAPFTIACPSTYGGPCVRQPAPGEALDALGDRLMHRLAYRNFGNREVLVANHSVQQPGAPTDGPVGVRWYEIRNPASDSVAVYQQGTWAPDGLDRWMGSIAMDKMGNIALGYSASGTKTPPGVRYTGRLRSEPTGRLEPEAVLVSGGGSQVDTYNRWGDYSAMTIDPSGDCNFWYTQEYIRATGSFNWSTRIGEFRFKNCK
ncbi:hypothetical protein NX773_22475 [Massilia solisilvae]|uniref:Uncharacterized protein n=1 Tax=Massilia solisilvae TaxID=1811225 RepID=A0ABT2BQZ1_9BURK|nr:hypothetical protein [Massilia solisilvae]MCS0610932.1 hypothetical protein [Massilia solisilvae]